ncbi:ArsR/SmtB family transcription factor [Halopiger goleimassiliensis]|uniref:ArsR/SmtB family transcription factor n=1 Tax=Halopiger goleimassiliensis TaxID=1293048 RepID=UPI000677F32F|nr:winged helix-turn-helix domain-containing protein [Halopiger goleimassiliensis]
MSEESSLETVVDLLDDEYARAILTAIRTDPMSANELSEHCDGSFSTIWRRLERLEEAGLVAERTRPRSDGNHDTVYAATVEEVRLRLDDDGFSLEIDRCDEDAADRLQRLWSEFP